jgi:predicted SprT family Zn-dependent metalloprotease
MKGKVIPFYDMLVKLGIPLYQLYQEIDRLKKKNREIKDKAAALLHLPFRATEAFEKARKELLGVICKE